MIETVSKQVHPDSEQATIDLMTTFGWILQSSQEINTKDSHLEKRGNDLYSVTETQNYVKLVFTRDNKMENYAEVSQLEREYNNILDSKPVAPPPFSLIIGGILYLMYVVPGVIYTVVKIKGKKKYNAEYASWRSTLNGRGKEILNRVSKLV